MKTYSQHQEDVWILENLKPGPGFFCDIGAFDGIASSNTLAFEEAGWTGMLIEPDPEMAWKCMLNRKMPVWCCAAGPIMSYGTFFVNGEDKGLSGLTAQTSMPIPVVVCPVSQLLAAGGCRHIDLLSIDTEGTELDAWYGIKLLNGQPMYKPRIVIMEHLTVPGPSRADAIVKQMNEDGYKEVHRTPINLIFVLGNGGPIDPRA